jgi:hypothetical protein
MEDEMTERRLSARIASSLVLCLTACAHAYRAPTGPEEATARVRFETHATAFSQLELFSSFHISVRDYGREECPGKWLDGGTNLGRIDMEREGDSVEIRVPTATRVFFSAAYSSQTLGASITCNLTYGFVPEAGHSYRIEHTGNRRACEVVVLDLTANAPVALMGRGNCPESV